jgi:N-acetyl-alpha-D-muramate 1-phosphate uridylyltransferase
MLPVAILAGGLATRLGPLTEKIPKSLIPIDGVPFVAHQLRLLRASGIQRVILCVGHMGKMIEQFVGDGAEYGLKVEYSYDGPALRGTAGAVRNALPKLGEAFFVMYGDSYLPCDYAEIERQFLQRGKSALMTVFRNDGRWDTSNVEFSDGKILAYSKKDLTPNMRYIDYGLGVFHASAFDKTHAHDLANVYSDVLKMGELAAVEVHERFYEIGSAAGLEETRNFLAQRE